MMEQLSKIRNIGFCAHIDAGKTTISERVLFYTGRIHKLGEVDDGTATMDYLIQEKERGITITSAVTYCTWLNHHINIIDTPGHVDFTAEVEKTLKVIDGVIIIFCAVGGVEPQSEVIWRQADKLNLSRIAFINKMDREEADFYKVVSDINKVFDTNAQPLQLPYIKNNEFSGIIDLITQKLITYEDELGTKLSYHEVPNDMKDKVKEYRTKLEENIALLNDELLDSYLSKGYLTNEELLQGIRKATITKKFVPTLLGSALKNRGIQLLLDAIINFLPAPPDLEEIVAMDSTTNRIIKYKPKADDPLLCFVFKTTADMYVDKLLYFRVYSGKLRKGMHVYNVNKKKKERIAKILRLHADKREEVEELSAGEVGALCGLKFTQTGDTLSEKELPVAIQTITFSEPVISIAIEPKTKDEEEKLEKALQLLSEEDPTLKIRIDEETSQRIISGMGELHLEIVIDKLLRDYKVNCKVGKIQIAYKETIKKPATALAECTKQLGEKKYFAKINLEIEPSKDSQLYQFENRLSPESKLSPAFISIINDSIKENMEVGYLLGYPLVNIKVSLIDIEYKDELNEVVLKIATQQAFQNALKEAEVILLEPIMKVEIVTPEEYLGDIINDLNRREAKIEALSSVKNSRIINVEVPLSKMFGYATSLRSLTQGRATHTMQFGYYKEVEEKVIKQMK